MPPRVISAVPTRHTGHDGRLGQVRRHEGRETGAQQGLDGKALQGELEQDQVVLEVVELLARHLGSCLEVDAVEACRDREVVLRLEVECPGVAYCLELASLVLAAVGNRWVKEVGYRCQCGVELAAGRGELAFEAGHLLLQATTFGNVSFALLRRELLLARSLVLVAAASDLVERLLESGGLGVQRDGLVHVDRDAASAAALQDVVPSFRQCFGGEHDGNR
jgi:hypothetical protein